MGFSPSIYCIFEVVNYLFYLTQLPPNSPVLSVRLPQVTLVLRWEDSNHSDRCTCSYGRLPGSALQPVEHVMALCCSSWSSSPSGTSCSGTSLSKHGHSDRSQCYINWGVEERPSGRVSAKGFHHSSIYTVVQGTAHDSFCQLYLLAHHPARFLSHTGLVCWGHTSSILCPRGWQFAQQANLVFEPDPYIFSGWM